MLVESCRQQHKYVESNESDDRDIIPHCIWGMLGGAAIGRLSGRKIFTRVGGPPWCGQISYLLCNLEVSRVFSVGLWPSILGVDTRHQHSAPALTPGVTTQHLHRWVLTRWSNSMNPPTSMLRCWRSTLGPTLGQCMPSTSEK